MHGVPENIYEMALLKVVKLWDSDCVWNVFDEPTDIDSRIT